MFKSTNVGANVARTVVVVHSRGINVPPSTRDASNPLGKPQRKDVPVPHSDVAKVIRSRHPSAEVDWTESTAEIFVFPNIQLGKRLDIYKWSAMQTVEFVGRPPQT
ncbi:hypothetical protein AAVH_11191 [Aphelenchoides avenae]|nr:hypothetical protein AAVH_11191 [Aphelenchus avenae]